MFHVFQVTREAMLRLARKQPRSLRHAYSGLLNIMQWSVEVFRRIVRAVEHGPVAFLLDPEPRDTSMCIEVEFSLVRQLPLTNGVHAFCKRTGAVLLAYAPLAMGRLTGKCDPRLLSTPGRLGERSG